jgi:hypothetical protein
MVLTEKLEVSRLVNKFSTYTATESPLQRSQQPATGPYNEPDALKSHP